MKEELFVYPVMKRRNYAGSGPTPSVLELDSIASVRSPAKPSADESTDSVCREKFKSSWTSRSRPEARRSKENLEKPRESVSRVGMSSKRALKTGSKIADSRVYSYDKIIECQEKLYDSDDFQFTIDDVEKMSNFA